MKHNMLAGIGVFMKEYFWASNISGSWQWLSVFVARSLADDLNRTGGIVSG
jgi:hypothetical protein